MFYRAGEPHGLPHSPFNALVVPRPIGWISSLDAEGRVNLAPFSFFNAVAYTPPQVMFAATGWHAEGGLKDSVANIEATGEFVVNVATWELREAVNLTSAPAPRDVDEFGVAGLEAEPAELVAPPRVKQSPAHLECGLTRIVDLPTGGPDASNRVVFGEVLGIHIRDEVLTDGLVDMAKVRPIGRLGYMDYTVVDEVFAMQRPGWPVPSAD